MRKFGLLKEANYPEALIGFALESFLTTVSFPFSRYSIEPFSQNKERAIGADVKIFDRIKRFKPIYFQFKKPYAYPDVSTSHIISDRKNAKPNPLKVKPEVIYFKLLDKSKHQIDFQHNVLFRLRQKLTRNNIGEAVYLCPLFLDVGTYRSLMHLEGVKKWLSFFNRSPWFYHKCTLMEGFTKYTFSNTPALSLHACIPPHKVVSDAQHKYSFTNNGEELYFHSPENPNINIITLDKLIYQETQNKFIETIQSNETLKDMLSGENEESLIPHPIDLFDGIDGIRSWLHFGDFIKFNYGIDQYAIIEYDDSFYYEKTIQVNFNEDQRDIDLG